MARRGWWLAGVIAIVVAAANVLIQVVRVTDVGAPESSVCTTIDPCTLQSHDVLDTVLPDAAVEPRSDQTARGGTWLEPGIEIGSCVLRGQGVVVGTLAVVVFRHRGHQFHLRPDRESKAQRVVKRMDALGCDCAHAMRTGAVTRVLWRPPQNPGWARS